MNAVNERSFGLTLRRDAVRLVVGVIASWALVWLLIALLKPLTVDPRPPPAGFFLAVLPLMLLIACGPLLGFGGTLFVTVDPNRVVVRRDRLGKRGEPLVVPRSSAAALRFSAERHQHRKQRHQGILYVEVDGRTIRLVDTASYAALARIAAELNGEPPPAQP